jgi:hypothetical protein
MPKPKSPARPEALQTIDPTALAGVSGGARGGRTAGSGSGGSGGGGGSGGDEALIGALTGILDSLSSLASQPQRGFNAQEMMLFMMMMQQRSGAVQIAAQPALPVIYTNGTNRIF